MSQNFNKNEFYTSMFEDMYQQVKTMHKVFGNPVIESKFYVPQDTDYKLLLMRHNLIKEEFNETVNALNEGNIIDVIDGICDLAVVSIGAGLCLGYKSTKPWETSYSMVQVVLGDMDILALFNNIHIAISKMEETKDFLNVVAFYDLIDWCLLLFRFIDMVFPSYNLKNNFDEVMKSNMSKTCDTEILAKETQDWYKTEKNIDTYREFVEEYNVWVVKRLDGKFLKSLKWCSPKIKLLD